MMIVYKLEVKHLMLLLLNQNKISKILINNLSSPNKNIKGFTSLVLANRNEKECNSRNNKNCQ